MARGPPLRRLTLVREGEDEAVRRYRLARLDEVALASPPFREHADEPPAAGEREPAPEAEDPG